MKILIDARMYGLEYTGIGRYVMNLLENINAIDNKNDYYVLLQRKYFRTLTLNNNFTKVLADFKPYQISEQIGLLKILLNLKPQLAHFPHFNIPLFWRGKYVVTIHDMTMHRSNTTASNLQPFKYWVKKFVYKFLFRMVVQNSVKIFTPSETIKNEISSYYKLPKSKVVVTYEGFSSHKHKIKSNKKVLKKFGIEERRYLLYVGNLYPHKNIMKAVAALKHVNESGLNIKFLIVSKKDKFFVSLEKYLKGNAISKQVIFTGFVDDSELEVLYANSLAFIYPSLSEGFGLQGLEALSAGTQLICSDIEVFREIYGDYATYFDPQNLYSIARVIKHISSNTKRLNIQKLYEKYSWVKMARLTIDVYNSIG